MLHSRKRATRRRSWLNKLEHRTFQAVVALLIVSGFLFHVRHLLPPACREAIQLVEELRKVFGQ
jgi:hypothetical protein